jgi:hypothetical protein
MIYAGPPVSRRVLDNRGLTMVTVPADTDSSAAAQNSSFAASRWPCAGQTLISPRCSAYSAGLNADDGMPAWEQVAPEPASRSRLRRSPGSITQVRSRSALASGLMRIG